MSKRTERAARPARSGASKAGVIIAGFGIGGIFYSAVGPLMIAKMARQKMMLIGGLLAAIAIWFAGIGLPWLAELICFVVLGCNFYMLFTALYAEATELAPTARASTMSLLSCHFFLGQTAGPIVFGTFLNSFGGSVACALNAAILAISATVASVAITRQRASIRLGAQQEA
jgi:predicted MFS family arabinose efflux permease